MYTGDGLTKYLQKSANKFGRKTGFKIENEIEDQDQSIQKLIGILTHVFEFYLEGQGQSPPKTIEIWTKVFYIYGPNLVILAETGHEL